MNYEVKPKRSNYKAHLITLALVAVSVVAFVVAGFLPNYSVLVQSLGIIVLVPAIYIAGKYMIAQYLYRVSVAEDGRVDFDVFLYRGGTKMQLVCRIELWEIKAVALLTEENRRPAKGMHRYSYCADMRPERALVLSVTNEDGDCEVLLSFDEKLAELLREGGKTLIS